MKNGANNSGNCGISCRPLAFWSLQEQTHYNEHHFPRTGTVSRSAIHCNTPTRPLFLPTDPGPKQGSAPGLFTSRTRVLRGAALSFAQVPHAWVRTQALLHPSSAPWLLPPRQGLPPEISASTPGLTTREGGPGGGFRQAPSGAAGSRDGGQPPIWDGKVVALTASYAPPPPRPHSTLSQSLVHRALPRKTNRNRGPSPPKSSATCPAAPLLSRSTGEARDQSKTQRVSLPVTRPPTRGSHPGSQR